MKIFTKPGTIAAIIIGIILFAMSSCGTGADAQGYPVVNETANSLNPWLITKASVSGDAANFYYRKGDSTRYIQTVNHRITIDIKYKTLK